MTGCTPPARAVLGAKVEVPDRVYTRFLIPEHVCECEIALVKFHPEALGVLDPLLTVGKDITVVLDFPSRT